MTLISDKICISTSTANLLEHEFSVDNTVKSALYYSKADDGFYVRNKTNGILSLGTDNSSDLSIETGGGCYHWQIIRFRDKNGHR